MLVAGTTESVCFAALNGDRYVYGLIWQFNIDGDATTHGKDTLARNCISIPVPATGAGATIQLAAAAGGQQLSLALPVGASARIAGERAPTTGLRVRSTTTAGERAAAIE